MSLNSGNMGSTGDRPDWLGAVNPFPQAAVARVYGSSSGQLTIRTEAVGAAHRFVRDYLAATRAPDDAARSGTHLTGKGKICVIEGEFGTGKTHLATELLSRAERARAESGTDMRVAYQVVPGGSFLSVYAGVLKDHIGENEMVARVQEWYADIVAEELRDRPYTGDLAARVRRDDVDPQVVVERYGLKEGALRDKLRRRLAEITPDGTFSRVLMLLLQPELRPLAWRWLTGETPDEVLAERGITRPIATDVQAMDALGVVARLYGRRDRRFVLAIDEMENLAAAWDTGDVTHAQAFKRLLAVFRDAGALLVVCGLPDIFEILPRDTGRVDAVIHPSRLTVDNVRSYVTQTQRRAFGRDVLRPFTDESAGYISYLTRGVARDVVRICYLAFEQAAQTGQEVTPALVRQVARDQLPGGGADRVRADIAEILADEGWLPDRRRAPGPAVIDFWIPGERDGAGCAIRVSDSVLGPAEADALAAQAAEVVSGATDRAVILVVAGYLPPEQKDRLAEAVGEGSLIIHHARTFREDFSRVLVAAMDRVGGAGPAARRTGSALDQIRVLRAASERSSRQQASTLRALQELLQRTDAIADAVDELRRPSPAADPGDSGALPPALERMFSRAEQSLAAYGDVRRFLDMTFEISSRQPGERFPLTHRFRAADAFSPVGIAAYLASLLGSFRGSVQSWLAEARRSSPQPGPPAEEERERLREICQTYDSLYGVAQVYKLDPLPDRLRLAGGDQDGPPRSARREALEEAFGQLGARVYRTALEAAGGIA